MIVSWVESQRVTATHYVTCHPHSHAIAVHPFIWKRAETTTNKQGEKYDQVQGYDEVVLPSRY